MPDDQAPQPPPPAKTVEMAVRPFWKDPLFLLGAGYFVYSVAEQLAGQPLSRDAFVQAVFGAVLALGRMAAPYVRSFLPFFDQGTPPRVDR